MRIIPLIYLLWIYKSCSLARQIEQEGQRETTLDVNIQNSSFVNVIKWHPYGIDTRICTAIDGYRISSVEDGGITLWKEAIDCSCERVVITLYNRGFPDFFFICTRNKEGEKNWLYYRMKSYRWKTIEEEEFYKCFNNQVFKESTLKAINLKIKGGNDASKLYINGSPDFPFAVYAPNVGYRITDVTCHSTLRGEDDKNVVWTADSLYEGCLYAAFYPRGSPKVGYLIIQTKDGIKELFCQETSGMWVSATKDGYLKKLAEIGFKESEFTNEITLDLSRPNEKKFRIKEYNIGNYGMNSCIPFVGFRMRAIVDDGNVVWKASGDERCTYINTVHHNGSIFAFYILVENSDGDRSVVYFIRSDGEWKSVTKSEYHAFMPVRVNGMALPKMEGKKIVMSSFKNKNGLRIATYSSVVDSSKGDIILVHGLRSHFMSEFGTSNVEWNYEHYGSPASLDINGLFLRECKHKRNPTDMHKHLFERTINFEGKDASLVQPGYEYEGSLIEFLNKLGYNVYGMDLQSHGLSDGKSEKRCHIEDFRNYIYDLLHFVGIIRRGKFSNPDEEFDVRLVYGPHSTDRRMFLLGHSMGGNILIQASQEFYKHTSRWTKFVDSLIIISGMLNINYDLSTFSNKATKFVLSLFQEKKPSVENPYETPLDCGETFDTFLRYKDPFFETDKLTFKAAELAFKACADVNKKDNMAYYLKTLPTIFLHSRDDGMCSIKGPRDMMNNYFKNNEFTKFVEFDGSFHYLTIPQAMVVLQSPLKEWLDDYT